MAPKGPNSGTSAGANAGSGAGKGPGRRGTGGNQKGTQPVPPAKAPTGTSLPPHPVHGSITSTGPNLPPRPVAGVTISTDTAAPFNGGLAASSYAPLRTDNSGPPPNRPVVRIAGVSDMSCVRTALPIAKVPDITEQSTSIEPESQPVMTGSSAVRGNPDEGEDEDVEELARPNRKRKDVSDPRGPDPNKAETKRAKKQEWKKLDISSAPLAAPEQKKDGKARRRKARQAQSIQEFATWTNDSSSEPRGAEHPTGGQLNKARYCDIILESRRKKDDPREPRAKNYSDWKYDYDLDSQTPCLRLYKGGSLVLIQGNQLFYDKTSTTSDGVFKTRDLPATAKVIKETFTTDFETPHITDNDVELLVLLGTNKQSEDWAGLSCLNFRVRGTFRHRYAGKTCGIKQEVIDLIEDLNDMTPIVTLVRMKGSPYREVDTYWMQRARTVAEKGVFPFFDGIISKTVGSQFESWTTTPDLALPRQPWMALPDKKHGSNFQRYASRPAKRTFGQMAEWEARLSMALIRETEHDSAVIKKYFSWGIEHNATVVLVKGSYVQLEVQVERLLEYSMPDVDAGSKFYLRPGLPIDPSKGANMNDAETSVALDDRDLLQTETRPQTDMVDDEPTGLPVADSHAPDDEVMDTEYTGPVWKAHAMAKVTNKSFILSLKAPREGLGHFPKGGMLKVQLQMERNSIPSTRQLIAIGRLAQKPTNESSIYVKYLQRFLLGEGSPFFPEDEKSPKDERWDGLSDEAKEVFATYVRTCGLNGPQKQAWTGAIEGSSMVSQIQGPPGTGKTFLDSAIALSFAMLGINTVVAAPSNKACDGIMKGLVGEMEKLTAIYPDAGKWFKIVYLPTSSKLKREMSDPSQEANDMVDEEDASSGKASYNKYTLWAHIVQLILATAESPQTTSANVQSADQWLDTLEDIRAEKEVSGKVLKEFLEVGVRAGLQVLSDPTVKIVVATSNNSAQIRDSAYQVEALILDEVAYAPESDSAVPLALGAKRIVLSGDHEQLRPLVKSRGASECSNQYGLSLYERVLGQNNIPLFRLKINYRMHEDIALLPGILNYGWLGCGGNTMIESHEYKYVKAWYDSVQGKRFSDARRAPAWENKENKSIRRLLFNVRNGRSVVAEDSSSLINYANVNAICDLVLELAKYAYQDPTVGWLRMKRITVLTPYKQQAFELERAIQMVLKDRGLKQWPNVCVVDSIQGDQNSLILLDLTAANPRNGALVGFIKDFHRLNVAITRAKDVLWMVGNLDRWRSQLQLLMQDFKGTKMGYMILDLLDLGDIIDVQYPEVLPQSVEELSLGPAQWTKKMPKSAPRVENEMKQYFVDKAAKYANTANQLKFETKCLEELKKMRRKTMAYKAQFDKTDDFDAPLFSDNVAKNSEVSNDALDTIIQEGSAVPNEDVVHFNPDDKWDADTATDTQIEEYNEWFRAADEDTRAAWTANQQAFGSHNAPEHDIAMGDDGSEEGEFYESREATDSMDADKPTSSQPPVAPPIQRPANVYGTRPSKKAPPKSREMDKSWRK